MGWARVTTVVVATSVIAGVTIGATRGHTRALPQPQWDVAAERSQRDADIAWYLERADRDPTGAMDRLRLAALYLQRARERGSPSDLLLAEAAARQSLANRRAHNSEAFRALAIALIGQHRFAEAAEATDSLLADAPDNSGARSLRGEIALEQGDYQRADSIFQSLTLIGSDPGVTARISRWAALRGDAAKAKKLLLDARGAARQLAFTPAEQIAWFDLRLGELALTTGDFKSAAKSLEEAATVVPDDPRVLMAQSQLALLTDHPTQALAYAESAMNHGEDPLAFAKAAEALRRLGRDTESAQLFRAFEAAIAAAPPSAWHRQWRLALIDRGVQVAEVLEQARAELTLRRDVYGLDLYAWALHRAGRDAEAKQAMTEALQWGTEDVMLASHAKAMGVAK